MSRIRFYLLLVVSLLAGSQLVEAQMSPQQILGKAISSLQSQGASKITFTSTFSGGKGEGGETTQGVMYLRGDSFRLQYGKTIATFDGKTLRHYDADAETLTISNPTQEELWQISPIYFLRSKGQGCSIKVLPASKTTEILEFTPKGKVQGVKSLEVAFSRSNGLPDNVVLHSTQAGSKLVFKILSYVPTKLDSTMFSLSERQFPGCEVVDLRN